MKIKHLRFKNLNSLEGEWSIDFTVPEFESEGIFVITGPTGVGKTTILDAICLALYGRTPRLDRVNASSNEIMSRQTGECFAEVTFSTNHGVFRCHWSQRRSRGKAEGKLQSPKHEISNHDDGAVIENMLSKVGKKVEDVCGMDFERFTRSVMLAQGNFAKFLQSSADDRSPILEQITGTSIYTEISKLVHQRKSDEEGRVKEHQAQMDGIALLDPETIESLKSEADTLQKKSTQDSTELKKHQTTHQWLESIQKEESTISQTEKNLTAHQLKLTDFQPCAQQLSRALKAHDIEPIYAELTSLQQTHTRHLSDLTHLGKQIISQSQSAESTQQRATEAASALATAKQNQDTAEPKLIDARKRDTQGQQIQEQIDSKTTQWKEEHKKHTSSQANIDLANSKLKTIDIQEAEAQHFLKAHAPCATLASEYSGITQRAERCQETSKQESQAKLKVTAEKKCLSTLETKLHKAEQSVLLTSSALQNHNNKLTSAQTKLTDLQDGASTAALENQLELLENNLRLEQKIVSLEDERTRLINGSPCPLCGSKDHPYSTDTPPTNSETENSIQTIKHKLKSIRTLESSIQKIQLTLQKAEAEVHQAKEHTKTITEKLTSDSQSLQEEESILADISAKAAQELKKLTSALAIYFPDSPPSASITTLPTTLADLKKLNDQWTAHTQTVDSVKEQKIHLSANLEHEHKNLQTHTETLSLIKRSEEELGKQLIENQQAIRNLIGSSSITEFDKALKAAIQKSETDHSTKNKQREEATNLLNKLKAQHTEISKQETLTANRIQHQNDKFLPLIAEKEFADLNAFLAARMKESERKQLELTQRDIQDTQKSLETTLRDAELRLQTEKKKQLLTITPLAQQEIQEIINTLTSTLTDTAKQLGAIQEKLSEDLKSHSRLAAQLTEKKNLEKELARWNKLHSLIGSSDGKKFRNFAQGLTFEIMVRHANAQLTKMSDRYQLIRDKEAPLDLNVIDSYQAGEIRSTKNLSGGESFIISLALALGLSQMASKTVRVDSLFLDEGFGTLDEEALETALETLSSLNQEGKLIGIISHITALKERIPTQLNLIPTQQGKATITGPGVSLRSNVE